jgi:hypothetical protein
MRARRNLLLLAALALLAACAPKIPFLKSDVVPGVDAAVDVKADNNGNSLVKLQAKFLPPANRLVPPKVFYMVWAQHPEGRVVPLGRLWIGEQRQGSFAATVPFLEFRILISAEKEVVPEHPSEPIVLSTDLLRPTE